MELKSKKQIFLPRQTSGRLCALFNYSSYLFFIIGFFTLSYYVYVWLDASIYQAYQSQKFQKALEDKLLANVGKVPIRSTESPVEGMSLGRIEIHTIGIAAMILEGSEESSLQRGVGHIIGTSLPGQQGNIVLSAHRNTFFRPLHDIKPDDEIILTTLEGYYRYRVESTKVVDPEEIDVLNDTGEDILTLVTCYPFNYIGKAPQRFIVRAHNIPVAK